MCAQLESCLVVFDPASEGLGAPPSLTSCCARSATRRQHSWGSATAADQGCATPYSCPQRSCPPIGAQKRGAQPMPRPASEGQRRVTPWVSDGFAAVPVRYALHGCKTFHKAVVHVSRSRTFSGSGPLLASQHPTSSAGQANSSVAGMMEHRRIALASPGPAVHSRERGPKMTGRHPSAGDVGV